MSGVIYPINNKEYTAEDVEIFNCTRTSGVHSVLDFDLSLSGNVLTVGKGLAWIKNADFKGKAVAFTESETITLDSADSTLDRYDVVAVRYDATKKEPELIVIKGTASENPVMPKRNTESYLYELFLYSILRKAGESTASFENVTDLRENKNYCGIMEDSVTSAVAPVYETLFEYKGGENSVLKVGDTIDFDYSKYQFFIATIDGAFSENDIILTPTEDKTGQNKFTCLIGSNVISVLTGSSKATFYLRAQIKIDELSVTTGHTIQIVQTSNTADFNLENIDNSYITKLVGVTKQPKGYVAVDDVFNPKSHNAQSGEAVEQAIDEALAEFEPPESDVDFLENLRPALKTFFKNVQTLLTEIVYTREENIGNEIIQNAKDIVSVLESVTPEEPETPTDKTLVSISATYAGGNVTVGKDVSSLTDITVTATYSDGSTSEVTGYTLSGEIVEGENTITVIYEGLTTTFTVIGEEVSIDENAVNIYTGFLGMDSTSTSEPTTNDTYPNAVCSDLISVNYESGGSWVYDIKLNSNITDTTKINWKTYNKSNGNRHQSGNGDTISIDSAYSPRLNILDQTATADGSNAVITGFTVTVRIGSIVKAVYEIGINDLRG